MIEISYEDFEKLDIRIGKVISAEKVDGADKLMKLTLNMGDHERQVVAGVAEFYKPEELVGKEMPVLVNLSPRKLRGEDSNGMILAADDGGHPVLVHPDKEIPPGSVVR